MTFYYSNQQSARLMFYHDHAFGITRLNVYAGEAAGYLLQDPTEAALVSGNIVPADQIPPDHPGQDLRPHGDRDEPDRPDLGPDQLGRLREPLVPARVYAPTRTPTGRTGSTRGGGGITAPGSGRPGR